MGTPTGRCEVDVGVSEVNMKHVLIKGEGGGQSNPPPSYIHMNLFIARIRVSVITRLKCIFSSYIHFCHVKRRLSDAQEAQF